MRIVYNGLLQLQDLSHHISRSITTLTLNPIQNIWEHQYSKYVHIYTFVAYSRWLSLIATEVKSYNTVMYIRLHEAILRTHLLNLPLITFLSVYYGSANKIFVGGYIKRVIHTKSYHRCNAITHFPTPGMYTLPKITSSIIPLRWYRWPNFHGLAHGLIANEDI